LAGGGCRPHSPAFHCAKLLSFRRLATASNETLGRRELQPPHPRFPLLSACLADGSLPRATKRLPGGGCGPYAPAFRGARLLSCRGLGAVGKEALERRGCRPHTPVFHCTRLALQAVCYRAQRNACHPARAHLRNRIVTMTPRQISRVGARMRLQFGLSGDGKSCLYSQSHFASAPISRIKPPRPHPFFEDKPPG
jgi:hypothetical protein